MHTSLSPVISGLMIAGSIGFCWATDGSVKTSSRPDQGSNRFTISNRSPLGANAFSKLRVGSIRPEGWVRKQLELEAEGYTGRLTEISPWLSKQDNAWLSPTGVGKNGWEEVPYWLKGFGDLGYVLGNKRIINEAKVWIEGALKSQRSNGYFGPEANLTANQGKPDIWPNMVMLNALQTYHEYTGDKRVLECMSRYFKWEMTIPDKDFLLSYWEPQRAGDNMQSVFWLYNRTGDRSVLPLAEKLHRCGARWDLGVPDWHGVNMAQGFREPAEYSQLAMSTTLTNATERDYLTMRNMYGQVPGGLYGADENARKGFSDPRQASETCTMVEMMLSDEMLLAITGDPAWAERCEDVAFNSLPASMTPDLKALHYLTSPNMIQIDKGSKSPGLQNSGPMLLFNAYDHRCCQHNASHGWPYYAEHLWYGAANNGLAALLYAPCIVTARVGSGMPVTVTETTNYPFDETVKFAISTKKPNSFPLVLRWPTWCQKPQLVLNGTKIQFKGSAGCYITINRTWKNGDQLNLTLPMVAKVHKWEANKGALSVERGPLTYSLKIGEKYVRAGGTDRFPSYEIYPTTPWNYGLSLDHLSFKVVKKSFPKSQQPFTPQTTPITIETKGRLIPQWQEDSLHLVGLLQTMPAKSTEPLKDLELIPMGAARLRISSFPTVLNKSTAHTWVAPRKPKPSLPTTASHVFDGDTVDALSDGLLPTGSTDMSIRRFTWWDHKGTREWVQYNFPKERTLSQSRVYWYDDKATGGECRVPASWTIYYQTSDGWKPVSDQGQFGTEKDKFNSVVFTAVKTKALRIEVQLQPHFSSGILEWEVH